MTLTRAQQTQLRALRTHGAVSFETALSPFDGRYFEPPVLARLNAAGLVESKTHRQHGGQRTVHWLTVDGQQAAAQLQEA